MLWITFNMEKQTENYLGYVGLNPAVGNTVSLKLYAIKNLDGTVRWVWNANNSKPDFLRFYTLSSFRSRFFSLGIKLIFLLKLQHFIFKKSGFMVSIDKKHALATYTEGDFALFTGIEGPNRKLVLYANCQFVKIGLTERSIELIENESFYLRSVKNGKFIEIPELKSIAKGIIGLSDLGMNAERQNLFSALHAEALHELYSESTIKKSSFNKTEIYKRTRELNKSIKGTSYNQIPVFLKEKLETLGNVLDEEQLVFTMAHRDFTPWNCFVSDSKIRLYDFELAHPQLPFGFDAFHFVIQQGILVERLPWKIILPRLKSAFKLMSQRSQLVGESFEIYLKAYLYINISYHIDLYSQQDKWHEQINWLFNTWNDALSDLLQNDYSNRAMVTSDLFDFLQNERYAVIKYPNIHPKDLDEWSDIDLLTTNGSAKNVLKYLSNHSLVSRLKVKTQSHMISIIVILKNGQLLALDLIWQLKRKSLAFMDVETCLHGIIYNYFGIKTLSPLDTKEYLQNFYGLNGSAIPNKYLSSFDAGEPFLSCPYQLSILVKSLPCNNGVSGVINKIKYAFDVLRNLFHEKGIIITFSGVDGAGKSTIIEKTKYIIEKKLRKKVVVIRHRPSLLPILSALTQGKEKAEQKAANTLPRQGQNKNSISSLLRFGYYYLDYLIGQFYVYTKHVLRGEVVLYDRYYFDFINDGLRSNIRLPKWITKMGYRLLLAPHLNFFLYADAQTILSRKKELDEKAITDLTREYLNLFFELDAKVSNKYFPIENLQIEKSLQFITDKAQAKIFLA
jgi:thymidylate kinase